MATTYSRHVSTDYSDGRHSERTWSHTYKDAFDGTCVKGGPNFGYPYLLGKADLTTQLDGEEETYDPLRIAICYAEQNHPGYSLYRSVSGCLTPQLVGVPPFLSGLEEVVYTKLLANIFSSQQKVAGGVIVGEIRETLTLLRNPIKGLNSAAKSLPELYYRLKKRYNIPRDMTVRRASRLKSYKGAAHSFTKEWTNLWLEWKFAVTPLISDVVDSIEELNRTLDKEEFHHITADDSDEDFWFDFANYNHDSFFEATVKQVKVNTVECKGAALVRDKPSGRKFDPERFGFRANDFVPTVYELIPFSFLADYFSNLGDLISAQFVVNSGVVYKWIGQERKYRVELVPTLARVKPDANPPAFGEYRLMPGRYLKREVKRWNPSDLDTSFTFEVPSNSQLVNVGALLNGFLNIK